MRTTTLSLLVAALGLVALTGCTPEAAQEVDAEHVPAAPDLMRFCDGPVAIYFAEWNSPGSAKGFVPNGCIFENGRWVFNNHPPATAPGN